MSKKVIIIGASSGIGKALAVLYAKEGCKVGVTGRRAALLMDVQKEFPENIVVHPYDVNAFESDTELAALAEKLGGADVVVYSSGVGEFNKHLDFGIEKQMIDTNVTAFTQVADWTFNYFQQHGYGSFASITSMAGLMGSRHAPAYNASKAFQINYLKSLRQKAKRLKLPVTITDLRTGFVDTAMAKADGKFWVASAEKAAAQMVRAIHNKKGVAYVTKRWRIVGILLRLFA
jgi:short-subunit dehydrogenase